MIGILAEKPSAMRAMAKAFGGSTGVYNNEPFLIVAARGHLYEMLDPYDMVPKSLSQQYKSWDLANLPWNEDDFSWKYKISSMSGAKGVLDNIKTQLSKCDEICIGTDDDPSGEGELLAWEILDGLRLAPKKWSRMYFEDEAVPSLQKAFKNRKPIQSMQADPDYQKAFYRQRWDYMSIQFTRIATMCGDGRSVLRQGRLKSAMVLLVGDALKALSEYKKIPFYQNRFKDENGVVYTNPDEPCFKDKSEVPNTYHASGVACDSKTMKSTVPPKLIDLASLASRLAPKGFAAKHVTDVYQKMYEDQIVSYPRTEDKFISIEQFNDLLPLVDKIAGVIGVDVKLLTHRTPRNTHVKQGGAHGANRPGPNVPSKLADLDKYGDCASQIYEILAANYLAMLCEDYEYEQQKGHVVDYPDFIGTANVPKKQGWKAIYHDDDSDDEDDSGKGLGTNAEPFIHEGFPPKPPTPTMKWLMGQLRKREVGTAATMTSTYAEVTNANSKYPLMTDTRGKIGFTQFGEMSYKLLPGTHIGSLDLTEKLWKQMKEVAAGTYSAKLGLHEIQQMVREDIDTMTENGKKMRADMGINISAGSTGSSGTQAEYYACKFNGQDIKFKRVWSGHRFTDDECEKLANGEEIIIQATSSKTGNTFKCKGVVEQMEYKGKTYYGFSNKGFISDNNNGGNAGGSANNNPRGSSGVPKSLLGHTFTQDERDQLEAGLSIECDDFISRKTGNKFKAKLRYGAKDDGTTGIIFDFDK